MFKPYLNHKVLNNISRDNNNFANDGDIAKETLDVLLFAEVLTKLCKIIIMS